MDFLRKFWDAATDENADAGKLDEGVRFPICNARNLANAFEKAGLANIETSNLDVVTTFKDYDDYWNPFLGGQGPAGSYLVSLDKVLQTGIKNNLRKRLPFEADGTIKLLARAIAVRANRKS